MLHYNVLQERRSQSFTTSSQGSVQCPLIFAWIMNAVFRDLLSSVIYLSRAFLVWRSLEERFDKVNGSRIYQLHQNICVTNQGLDLMFIYFNRLKLLGTSLLRYAVSMPTHLYNPRRHLIMKATSSLFNS